MNIQQLFIRSNEALGKVVSHISSDQWDLSMPKGSVSKPGTLGQSVRYHAYDDAWIPDVLAGKTKDEVGDKYDPILTIADDEIQLTYRSYNEAAMDEVSNFDDLDRIVHLSYGDYSARDYLQHIVSFRAFRAYDIAALIGVDVTFDHNDVQALWDEFSPVIESYRAMGVFPAAIEVPESSDLQTKLLAMVGKK